MVTRARSPCIHRVEAGRTAVRLQSLVPVPLRNALRRSDEGGVPAEPGCYAWWVEPGALPGVPPAPHPVEPWSLLYVGIAPGNERSAATLRSRVLNNHVRGNVGSSTFRFVLASMLFEVKGWRPTHSRSRPSLHPADNLALREWHRPPPG